MNRQERAFTLADLILVVLFIGIFVTIAVPKINFSVISRQKADALARKIVTDLRRTRMLAISNAANNTKGFNLKMSESAPYTNYQIENDDTKEIVDSHAIDSAISCSGGQSFKFTPLGNLSDVSDTQLTITAEGKTFTITIIPATGAIKCVEN